MWRFKLLVVTVVVVGPLLFGAVVVHARGWSWNSQINVESIDVGTEWTVSQGWASPPALPAAPSTITNKAGAPGTVTITLMLGMGDSIGEGVQSGDASRPTQRSSYLVLLARQIGVPLYLPSIRSGPLGVVGNTSLRSRLLPGLEAANLSVSGADVNSLLNDQADATSEALINSETDLVLFPRLGSQIQIAESIGAPLIVCWIGNNDVLSAVISFSQFDASQMTPVAEFAADFHELAQRLQALGGAVVFANIPDVAGLGFLVDRQDLIKFLGNDFGLAEGDFTSIVVMLAIRLGLDDGSLLADPNFVLDASEVELIRQRINAFNQIIADEAAAIGMPVVDIHALFETFAASPPVILGVPITPRFLGGFFSLDGVHPSNIGHAIIANAFIRTINLRFDKAIPLISPTDLALIFLADPFVAKDNDGRVSGRFGAGFFETLGPFLGISGDRDDFTPDSSWDEIDVSPGEQFVERTLPLQGKDPQGASEWDRAEFIEAFRYIFNQLNNTG